MWAIIVAGAGNKLSSSSSESKSSTDFYYNDLVGGLVILMRGDYIASGSLDALCDE